MWPYHYYMVFSLVLQVYIMLCSYYNMDMRHPKFTLQDIKYADDPETFFRAEELFRSGKVGKIQEDPRGYRAKVQGTKAYEVSVSYKRIDEGSCSCYMGKNNILCKHMLALSLAVLDKAGGLNT